VAATFVTPGFSLTCGIADVACFGVLLPLIKDFFWIAIVIPPSCIFLDFVAASTARYCR
jgi:hypothetical protein